MESHQQKNKIVLLTENKKPASLYKQKAKIWPGLTDRRKDAFKRKLRTIITPHSNLSSIVSIYILKKSQACKPGLFFVIHKLFQFLIRQLAVFPKLQCFIKFQVSH